MIDASQFSFPFRRVGDWACPNTSCLNHKNLVFARKKSCPTCGAAKPAVPTSVWSAADALGDDGFGAGRFANVGNVGHDISEHLSGHARSNGFELNRSTSVGQQGGIFRRSIETLTMPPSQPAPDRNNRNRDACDPKEWTCKCGQVNHVRDMFSRGNTCVKCSAPRPTANADMEWAEVCNMYNKGKKRKRRKSSYSSSSSSSSSHSNSINKRSRKSSSSKSKSRASKRTSRGSTHVEEVGDSKAAAMNPELEKAKNDALNKILKLRDSGLENEEKRRQWRAILREYHPDKHSDKELATSVFQFLQKGKSLLKLAD